MRRKIIIGLILFVMGILLQIVSDVVDVWIIGVFGGILWPVGMVMGIQASISLDNKKQIDNPSQLSDKEGREQNGAEEPNG